MGRSAIYPDPGVLSGLDLDGTHLAKGGCEPGEAARWAEPGVFVEDPVVVCGPGEIVAVATTLNVREGRRDLLVVAGETKTVRARVPLPHAVPFGFHGRYFSDV